MKKNMYVLGLVGLVACGGEEKVTNTEPTLQVFSPLDSDGFIVGDTVSFEGQIGDAEDAVSDLVVAVYDAATTLCEVSVTPDGFAACDFEAYLDLTTIRVVVTDTYGATASQSVSVEVVDPLAPVVQIVSPENNSSFYANYPITLSGTVSDTDTSIEALTLSWNSSIDGSLDLGTEINSDGTWTGEVSLSEGEHQISLNANDDRGLSDSESVAIIVLPPNHPPTCTFVSPIANDVFVSMENATISGTVFDGEVSTEMLVVTLESNRDGVMETPILNSVGEFSIVTDGLSLGQHTLILSATDEMGEQCSTQVDVLVNARPVLSFIEPSSGSIFNDGESITFSASVSDYETNSDSLLIEWSSDLDGVVGTASAVNGVASLTTDALSVGSHTMTLTVTDALGTSTVDSLMLNVNGVPTAPVISLIPTSAYTTDDLTVSIQTPGVDPEGDAVSYEYEWMLNGSIVASQTGSSISNVDTTKNDTWSVTVTSFDGTGYGGFVGASTTVQNSIPSVGAVVVSPSVLVFGDSVTCSYTGYTDADNDADQSTFEWFVNGFSVGIGSTLSAGFVGGDVIQCVVTPNDGESTGSTVEATVTVNNTAPVLSSVSIDPQSVYEGDTATCNLGQVIDVDNDSAFTFSYVWNKNGVPLAGVTTQTLSSVYFAKNDILTCSATPNDGEDDGVAVTSAPVVVLNTAPTLSSAHILPANVQFGDTLTCTGLGPNDVDGDSVTVATSWYVNGVLVSTSTSLSSGFVGGDTVRCELTPFDGVTYGSVYDSEVVVQNSLPVLASVSVTPSNPSVSSTLQCVTGQVTDADGTNNFSFEYDWQINGASQNLNSNSLAAGVAVKNQSVTCSAIPNDGTDNGLSVTSSPVLILNTAPSVSSALISPDPALAGETLTCGYTFTDVDGDSDQSTVSWSVGGQVVGSGNTYSGAFVRGNTVVCSVTANDGEDSGNSVQDTLTISNTPGQVSNVAISPSSLQYGDTATCSYSFYDVDGDSNQSTVRWLVNGQAWANGATMPASVANQYISGGSVVTCEVTAQDGYTQNPSTSTAQVTVSNTAPTVSNVSVSPINATSSDTLSCSYNFSDVDGDSDQSSVSWTVNGNVVSQQSTLSTGYVAGDSVLCSVTPNDGTANGSAVSASPITIGNSVPSVSSVSISPQTVYIGNILTCSYSGFTDVDGHSDQSSVEWLVNNSIVASGLSYTVSEAGGQSIVCRVTPNDGFGTGTPVTSSVTVTNTAPVIGSVDLSPTTAFEGTTLTCVPSGTTDADGTSNFSYTYAWYVNNVQVGSSSTLGSADFDKNDTVYCSAVASDGNANSAPVNSSTITVGNTAPSVSSVTISPSNPTVADVLSYTTSGWSDVDGDTEDYFVSWFVGNIEVSAYDTLSSSSFSAGDVVTVTITPYDGNNAGNSVSSASVTIVNSAPSAPVVSVSPAAATNFDTLTCSIATPSVDPDGDSVSYTYAWLKNGVDQGISAQTVSSSYTSVGQTWTCQVTATDGTSTVSATANVSICTAITYYLDNDGDGYGFYSVTTQACSGSTLPGYASRTGDCNDNEPTIYPFATELCDGLDNDCDYTVDEDAVDSDGDGYRICDGDCDDSDALVYPGAFDICTDGLDNDCDGVVDAGDYDQDGYLGCGIEDCNDIVAIMNPGMTEEPGDGLDNDCDGIVDSTSSDDDNDGYTENQGDCNDQAPWIHPAATEIPDDEIDQNCDGVEEYAADWNTTSAAIFVDAVDGDDFYPGTQQFPVQTISKATQLANQGQPIVLSADSFSGNFSTSGNDVFGGYDPADWSLTDVHSEFVGTGTIDTATVSNIDFRGDVTVSNASTVVSSVMLKQVVTNGSGNKSLYNVVIFGDSGSGIQYSLNGSVLLYNSVVFGSTSSDSDVFTINATISSVVFGSVIEGGTAGQGSAGTNGQRGGDSLGFSYCWTPSYSPTFGYYSGCGTNNGCYQNYDQCIQHGVAGSGYLTDGTDGGDGGVGHNSSLVENASTIGSILYGGVPGLGGRGGNGGNGYNNPGNGTPGQTGTNSKIYYLPGNGGNGGNGGIAGEYVISNSDISYSVIKTPLSLGQGEGGTGGVATDFSNITGIYPCTDAAFWGKGIDGQNGQVSSVPSTSNLFTGSSLVGNTIIININAPGYELNLFDVNELESNVILVSNSNLYSLNLGQISNAASENLIEVGQSSLNNFAGLVVTGDFVNNEVQLTDLDITEQFEFNGSFSYNVFKAQTQNNTPNVLYTNNHVSNNLFVFEGSTIGVTSDGANFINNTLYGTGSLLNVEGDSSGVVNNILQSIDNGTCMRYDGTNFAYFTNNLFWGCSTFVYDGPAGAARTNINATNFMIASQAYGGNLNYDPLFVDPSNDNFGLQSGSPAINTGYDASISDLGSIVDDIFGNARPTGGAFDIGAIEKQ